MIAAADREKFGSRSVQRQFAAHAKWNDLVMVAMKNGDMQGGAALERLPQAGAVIVVFDEEMRERRANHAGCFLAQGGEGRDGDDSLDRVAGREIEGDGCA